MKKIKSIADAVGCFAKDLGCNYQLDNKKIDPSSYWGQHVRRNRVYQRRNFGLFTLRKRGLGPRLNDLERIALDLEAKQKALLNNPGNAEQLVQDIETLQGENDKMVADIYNLTVHDFELIKVTNTTTDFEGFKNDIAAGGPNDIKNQKFYDDLNDSLRLSKVMKEGNGGSYYEVNGARMMTAATRRYLLDNPTAASVNIYPGNRLDSDGTNNSSLSQGLLGIAKVFVDNPDRNPITLKQSDSRLDSPNLKLSEVTQCENGFEALWKAVYLSVDSKSLNDLTPEDKLGIDGVKRFLVANNINDPKGELSNFLSETEYNNIGTRVKNTDLKRLLEQGRSNVVQYVESAAAKSSAAEPYEVTTPDGQRSVIMGEYIVPLENAPLIENGMYAFGRSSSSDTVSDVFNAAYSEGMNFDSESNGMYGDGGQYSYPGSEVYDSNGMYEENEGDDHPPHDLYSPEDQVVYGTASEMSDGQYTYAKDEGNVENNNLQFAPLYSLERIDSHAQDSAAALAKAPGAGPDEALDERESEYTPYNPKLN